MVAMAANVQHYLGGLADSVQGHPGVALRVQRKPGHGIQLEQERTYHPEEITHHGVGGPGIEQLAQAVTDIERAATVLLDQVPDPAGEAFKTAKGVDFDRADGRVVFNDRRMVAKPEVKNLPAGIGGGINEGKDETAIVIKVGNPPDNVIADSEVIQNLVQSGQTGRYPVFGLARFFAVHGRIR